MSDEKKVEVNEEILKEVFSNQEIRNLVLTGELAPKAVLAIDGKRDEILKDLVQKEGLEIVDVLDLYLDKENGLMKIIDLDTNVTLKIIKIKW